MKALFWTKRIHQGVLSRKSTPCVRTNETTQLLSSVPDGGRCRNKGRNGDDLSFHNISVARFVVRLAMPLASKKNGENWRRRAEHDSSAWRSGVLYLATPRRTRPAKLRKPKKPDPKVGSEWFAQDRDAASTNDHPRTGRETNENRMSRLRERHEPNIRETHETGFLRQKAGTAGERHVEMCRLAERGTGANEGQAHDPEELHEMAQPIGASRGRTGTKHRREPG